MPYLVLPRAFNALLAKRHRATPAPRDANATTPRASSGSGAANLFAGKSRDGVELAAENQRADLAVVLVSPQIPGNTGTIARTCAASRVPLHLVGPLGFTLEDSQLKRAGLDYWCVRPDRSTDKPIDRYALPPPRRRRAPPSIPLIVHLLPPVAGTACACACTTIGTRSTRTGPSTSGPPVVWSRSGAFCVHHAGPRATASARCMRFLEDFLSRRSSLSAHPLAAFDPDTPRRLSTPPLTPLNSTPTSTLSKFGARPHAEEGAYLPGDWLLFGAETTGLPDEAHDACARSGGIRRIPIDEDHVRSLNLAVSAGVGVYEAIRQIDGSPTEANPPRDDAPGTYARG